MRKDETLANRVRKKKSQSTPIPVSLPWKQQKRSGTITLKRTRLSKWKGNTRERGLSPFRRRRRRLPHPFSRCSPSST
nr:uncharacterized protein CTRU02_15532 [Colletotrichum truncatum]XP_036584649.1 uncharacterized protein CTRU02_05131 [Colletotrichum truncatum]KAF6780950.1 hypothetical protein CTRU02_15532 [Colletotrichum truncatum]KAF6794299.1 hypothetical protein CTRU02_05131 [Colletotrichum truncatum]